MKGEIREIRKENYKDFYKVYKVFDEPPYSEMATDEDIWKEYEFLTSGGHVFGYYENDCVGIVTVNKGIFYHHPIKYNKTEEVVYLSDVAVLKECRGRGIGTKLMKYAIEESKKAGYKIIYMRTLQPELYMSYKIALRLGFKLRKETEDVFMERYDKNRTKTDTRIFLDFQL